MRSPIGGIQKLILNREKEYSLEDIKNLCIKLMKNDSNSYFFDDVLIKLGNFYGEIFDEFTTSHGRKCNFWEFSNRLKSSNSQLRLYLYTSPIVQNYNRTLSASTSKISSCLNTDTVSKYSNINIHSSSPSKYPSLYKASTSSCAIVDDVISTDKVSPPTPTSNLISIKNNPVQKYSITIPIIDESDIKFSGKILGKGAFGIVQKATWHDTDVAVKTIELKTGQKYIMRELQTMDKIRHPNIISVMATTKFNKHCHIVMEYFDSHNLHDILFKEEIKSEYAIDLQKQVSISLQICKAINYLHQYSPPILHKDLKPANILVNKQWMAKICDLGLSKITGMSTALDTTVGKSFVGTPLYMAPEIILQQLSGTVYSDIWALACCLIEIFTGKYAYNVSPFTISQLKRLIANKTKPDLARVPSSLKGVLNQCFEHEPIKRPSAKWLISTLKLLEGTLPNNTN